MSAEKTVLPAAAGTRPASPTVRLTFEELFRASYPQLLLTAMYAGASPQEAEDAVSQALVDMYPRWDAIDAPLAYAKRAAISNLIKMRERSQERIRSKQKQLGDVHEGGEDPHLSVWEQREWVMQLLNALPPRQREVLALLVDQFSQAEIAQLLGRTKAAVRQNLKEARRTMRCHLDIAAGDSRTVPATTLGGEEAQ